MVMVWAHTLTLVMQEGTNLPSSHEVVAIFREKGVRIAVPVASADIVAFQHRKISSEN